VAPGMSALALGALLALALGALLALAVLAPSALALGALLALAMLASALAMSASRHHMHTLPRQERPTPRPPGETETRP